MDTSIKKRLITSVQVIPVNASNIGSVEPQFDGPDRHTTGWAVYLRGPDDLVEWFADLPTERAAMRIGRTVAELAGVEVEPQPWKAS